MNSSEDTTQSLSARSVSWIARLPRLSWWWGMALAAVLGAVALVLAQTAWMQQSGWSALTLAIVLGMLLGNSIFSRIESHTAAGVDFCRTWLLRAGIVLYGFRITFQQIAEVGWAGLLIDISTLSLTFALAWWLGTRWLRLDRETALLIGAGSSICGAAAVMATAPVVRAQPHQVSVAVATVVVFGTLAMFVYPLLYPLLGMSEHAYGVYVGSTVHEVAQVVVAGRSVGETAESVAVIEKMLRVMLLAPFLLLLSWRLRDSAEQGGGILDGVVVPWFAVWFIVASAVNSLDWLPPAWTETLLRIDMLILAMAMAALGLRTRFSALRQAGVRPLLLAAILFAFLMLNGYAINVGVSRLFNLV